MTHRFVASAGITHRKGSPQACFRQWRAGVDAGPGGAALLLVDFELSQYWLAQRPTLPLTALYCLRAGRLEVAVTDRPLSGQHCCAAEQFDAWTAQHDMVVSAPPEPLALLPTAIPKPWGREVWYSGVEARGVCCFGRGTRRTPIPWLQAALPQREAGAPGHDLVLLKILDPLPQPVLGDLYFELHQKKREVYVVIHVDESAWPGGVGYIRYGFDAARLAASGSDEAFRRDYLEAVQAYEAVRRELDAQPPGAVAAPDLLQRERSLRETMNSFTHLRELRVGDVVAVPLRLPHALQHGVRTIEFQTPVYERQILSFAQRVLTQDHWDTAAAVQHMLLRPPPEPAFDRLLDTADARVERIVDFPDFEVRRVRIQPGGSVPLAPLRDYALAMVVAGELALAGRVYRAEQAVLLPRGWEGLLSTGNPVQSLTFLLALPRR
ncbi:MAG: hypothetical protein KDI01_09015 [Halioglobus sp.]|nr:hypothetical protein [Halioglobus sp.]